MGAYKKFKEVSEENESLHHLEVRKKIFLFSKLLREYKDNLLLYKDVDIETVRSRCDTVFNVTLAEVDRIHDERVQDFQENAKQYLDGQIEVYEKVHFIF
jgi:sorting nexin-9/18/33